MPHLLQSAGVAAVDSGLGIAALKPASATRVTTMVVKRMARGMAVWTQELSRIGLMYLQNNRLTPSLYLVHRSRRQASVKVKTSRVSPIQY
jgi:hypothetical protein